MKKKQLEIFLQKTPEFDKPTPLLEQYITPANIVSDILFIVYQFGDIKNKHVIDLGCGTGIFSVGSCILGAKKVTGIDIDKKAIKIAKKYAKKENLDINFYKKEISDVKIQADTTIMNPPFGAQKTNKKADRKFIEKGFEISNIIYTLHLTNTTDFIEKMVRSLKGNITHQKKYVFPIKSTYKFHEKRYKKYNVTLFRIDTNK